MLSNENKQNGNQNAATNSSSQGSANAGSNPLPSISLPKGGAAIRGMGEKFAANPVTGTGSMTVPIFTSPGRSGFGWNMGAPSITRKTDKGLPRYWPLQQPWNLAAELLIGYTKGNMLIV